MEAPAPAPQQVPEVSTATAVEQLSEPAVPSLRERRMAGKAARPASSGGGGMPLGALLGAGLTLGLSLAGKFAVGLVKRKQQQQQQDKTAQQPSTASTPRQAGESVVFAAFGSPNVVPDTGSPRLVPRKPSSPAPAPVPAPASQAPAAAVPDVESKPVLPPGQLKQQLQLLQEMQEENARLHAFMKEYMATSDKVKVLEQENAELKATTSKLQTQLQDIQSKAVISNGDELSAFKDVVKDRFPAIARSVCSDLDFEKIRDTASVDGSASVVDNNTRRKVGALTQLFAWANQPSAPRSRGASKLPSQASTPRRSTQDGLQSSDVLQLLNAFSSGGMQL